MMKNQVTPEQIHLNRRPGTRSNPRLPVLVYRRLLPADAPAKARQFEAHFKESGWGGSWRDIIYDYAHFHATAHEALGIAKGEVTVELGGEKGERLHLTPGDLLVLPAGTAHRAVTRSDDLVVVGAYPRGQADYDMCTGDKCTRAEEHIAETSLPNSDPFFGREGPLVHIWQG